MGALLGVLLVALKNQSFYINYLNAILESRKRHHWVPETSDFALLGVVPLTVVFEAFQALLAL